MSKKNESAHDLIFGIHSIIELLKAKKRKLQMVYTTKPTPKAWSKISELLPAHVQVQFVQRAVLSKLAGTDDHQGVVGLAAPFVFRSKFFQSDRHPFLLMLDGIQDPKNLGAILRSAYCTNVSGVILTDRNSAPVSAAAIKSSAGLAEHLEIYLATSALQAAQQLKEAGYKSYLMTVDDSTNATLINYQLPLCVVIGSEATGISKNILKSGEHITLPQKNSEISYNASVAAGIALFYIATQKQILK